MASLFTLAIFILEIRRGGGDKIAGMIADCKYLKGCNLKERSRASECSVRQYEDQRKVERGFGKK